MTNSTQILNQTELDRLVDGELSDVERRDVISRCASTPDGWRRCALAFLEAQEFRQSFASIDQIAAERPTTSRPKPVEHRAGTAMIEAIPIRRSQWPIVAGAILLSFVAGLATSRAMTLNDSIGPTALQGSKTEDGKPFDPNEGRQNLTTQERATDLSVPNVEQQPLDHEGLHNGEVRIVGLVRIADESANAANYVMPVYAGDKLDQNWLKKMPLPYSEDQIRKLKREGYNVEQRRQLMQVTLADGQNLAIPFGTVQLHYVGKELH
jgi:hypothetical protein